MDIHKVIIELVKEIAFFFGLDYKFYLKNDDFCSFSFLFCKNKITKTHKTEEKLKQEIKENLKVVGQLLSNDYSYRYIFF